MNENVYTVYMHVFPDQKRYIGLTKNKVERRWSNGEGYRTQYVYSAIKKFGWDNIEHIVVADGLTCQEASVLEQNLIEKYDSMNNGYNRTFGGETSGGLPNYYLYKGEKYTIYELSEKSGLSIYSLKWRFLKGWSVEDAVETPQEEKYNKYLYNGVEYTVYELAEINGTGITPHGIQTRINRGWTVKDAVERPLSNNNADKRTIDGVVYTNKDLVEKSGIDGLTESNITSRLSKGWTLKRTLSQPKNVKLQPKGIGKRIYEYDGKMYNSYELTQLSPLKDLTISDISTRINRNGWSVERAITQPKRKMNITFEYNGKEYNSHELAEICVDKSMTYHDVTDRYRYGWSTFEIVNTPKGVSRKKL